MKKIHPQELLLMLVLVLLCSAVSAQEKLDIITKLNGERMEGKVTEVTSDAVKFQYPGEDVAYNVNKSEINKIEFSSGRTQVFNEAGAPSAVASPAASASATSTPADRKNKLAVLPFEFITNDQSLMPDQLSKQIQGDCINSFRSNSHGVVVQDPMTTNAMLAKAGIDPTTISSITPAELAEKLGVEYVVYGMTNITNKGTLSTGSQVTSYKDKEDKTRKDNKNSTRQSGTAVTTNSATTTVNYDTRVEMNIYNDRGDNVFSNSRDAFGSSLDSYVGSINYMVKRTPFGSKHK